jgi:hypothetical protein
LGTSGVYVRPQSPSNFTGGSTPIFRSNGDGLDASQAVRDARSGKIGQ